ncbi:MAG: hypothetical protein IT371_05030 [Deltaproteobacteria bacterium]|nr:hypothetical protein [Deltaproteobacteria bacterium]
MPPVARRTDSLLGRSTLPGALGAALSLSLLAQLAVYFTETFGPLGPLRNLAVTLATTLPLALALRVAARPELTPRSLAFWVVVGAAALRLALPWSAVEGSSDAFRYLFDGRVLASGTNPYLHPPVADALVPLREAHFFPGIFRPEMRTVYPPLAELWFAVAYWLSPTSFFGLKLVLFIHELATVLLLRRLLARAGAPPERALLYAWSPLPIVQLFVAGHLDGLLVPWLLLALLLAERRPFAAGLSLAASALVRPVTLLCLPSLALGPDRSRRQSLAVALAVGLATTLLLCPFLSAGGRLVESLLVYAQEWRFNGSLFALASLASPALAATWLRPALYAGTALASVACALLPAARSTRFLLALGAYFALAPTVYPWYLVPLLALGALHGGVWVVLLPALVGLSDLVFLDGRPGGVWEVPALAQVLEYGVLYLLVALQLARRARPGSERPPAPGPRLVY